ncbi:MAG: sulfatase-like hydrolase/transferase, partial [Planctomycetota bacterium]
MRWFCLCGLLLIGGPSFGADRPNVLLILADDIGRELLGSYGAEGYSTPRLDRLAATGTRFETCYATPLCSPTRVMLLTGRYSFRNYTQWAHMNPSLVTVAQLLRNAGYATGFAGKWQLSGWRWGSDEQPLVVRAGFNEYCSFDSAQLLEDSRDSKGNRFWGGTVYQDGRSFKLKHYGPETYSDYLVDFMRRHRDESFFAYYAMTPMHRPFHPAPTHPDAPIPGQAPPEAWLGSRGAPEHFRSMLTYADRMVGKLLDELKALGLDERTLVIFAADNGTDNKVEATTIRSRFRGRTIRGGKYFPTEMGAAVPLLIRWPGRVKGGVVSRALVDLTDLLPTICDAAGVGLPADGGFDGQSLLPLLAGERSTHKPFVYTWGNFEQNSKKYKEPVRYRADLLDVVRDER